MLPCRVKGGLGKERVVMLPCRVKGGLLCFYVG